GRRLRAAGKSIADARIVAKTGWTTDELMAAVRAEGLKGTFDLVTLEAGVNDQYRGYENDRFRESFDRLLRTALEFAKPPSSLIVFSIPDWGVTPFASGRDRPGIAREIDAFNDVIRRLADRAEARFVDVTPASRQASNDSA